MSGNALVAPVDTNPGFHELTDGLKAIDGAADAADAFSRGDWVEGSVNGLSAGIDMVGAAVDPIGTIGSMFAGWLLSHIGPVQDALDELLGDPATITAFAQTWQNCAEHLSSVSADYQAAAASDLAPFNGLVIHAYREYSEVLQETMSGVAVICQGVSGGVALGGTVLAGVRAFIVQIMSDAIGQIVKLLAEVGLTLGIAAPHAVTTAANKARQLITQARKLMDDLATSLDKFADLMGQISPALESTTRGLSSASHFASQMNSTELEAVTQTLKSVLAVDNYRD